MIFEEDPWDGKPFGAGEPGATVPLGVFKFNNLPRGMLFPPLLMRVAYSKLILHFGL